MIKYIGSKRKLVGLIADTIGHLAERGTVIDLFSGTSRVGHELKRRGYRVLANDHNAYAVTLARCYVQADREDWLGPAEQLIAELNRLPGRPGYFTETFCVQSRYLQPHNGERVDAIREHIAGLGLEPELEAVALVSLMEAADRVDSTTGLQMAYLKQWSARSHNNLELRLPDLLPRAASGKGEAFGLEAQEAARRLTGDVAYLDPPYNQHSYLGNYHVWESLVRWDKPAVYGVACKRVDCRERRSVFNSRRGLGEALAEVITHLQAPRLVVSFNNEGYLSREEMEALLSRRGCVQVVERDYKRYVGAQIGIYNPQGERVGAVSHLANKEYLYVVTPEPLSADLTTLTQEPSGEQLRLL